MGLLSSLAMTTVAIIPARGQSKGLPRKNVRLLDGVPLIVHTVRAALSARGVDRVVVSTDDPAIGAIAERAGAEVPFHRPPELATDSAPTVDAIRHAVGELEAGGGSVDWVLTLQPTAPFRTARDIEAALELQRSSGAQSVVSVARLDLPVSVLGHLADGDRFASLAPAGDVRRQASPQAVRVTGGIYLTARELLATGRLLDESPAALVVDDRAAIDIDSVGDLQRARRVARRGASR